MPDYQILGSNKKICWKYASPDNKHLVQTTQSVRNKQLQITILGADNPISGKQVTLDNQIPSADNPIHWK